MKEQVSVSPVTTMGIIGLLLLGGIGFFVYKTLGHAPPPVRTGWDGTRPYRCAGHDDVAFGGFIADLPNQTAITATEHCRLKLDGVTLSAATAIEASGNAVVVVHGGTIEGTTSAVSVSDSAHVLFTGTTVKGPKIATGNAVITGP